MSLKWSEYKTLLQDKLRYHKNTVIDPGKTAAAIEFGTPFDVRARLYLEQWMTDVYAMPVDKAKFNTMSLSDRMQDLQVHCAEPVFEVKQVWIDSSAILMYENYQDLQDNFDAVNTTDGKPFACAEVRPFVLMFNCVPDVFYDNSYVQGYGVQKITGDNDILKLPVQTLDTFAEYECAHFMSGVVDSRPGLDLLKMFNAKAYEGARAIKGKNLAFDFSGAQRGG